MPADYRFIARENLAKATELLKSGDDASLAYACLELRKCIEALSYDLLRAYLKEVPLRALETWQADKVMKELLRIDPKAHKTSRIRMRVEGRDGAADGPWREVGEDRRLDRAYAAKSYHQLGNFLHVPTIKQITADDASSESTVRARAESIRERLAYVLDSKIWNSNLGSFFTFNCAGCESPIARRTAVLEAGCEVECGNCGQQYDVEQEPDGKKLFIPRSFTWDCESCNSRREIAQRFARDGLDVSCSTCGDKAVLRATSGWRLERPENVEQSAGDSSDTKGTDSNQVR